MRQFTSGRVCGSPVYHLLDDAEREAAVWREYIGRAAVVGSSPGVRRAVRTDDQEALTALLDRHEPKTWVLVTSHRAEDELAALTGGGTLAGHYYAVPDRLLPQVRRIKGIRVLAKPPRHLTGGPGGGARDVPAGGAGEVSR